MQRFYYALVCVRFLMQVHCILIIRVCSCSLLIGRLAEIITLLEPTKAVLRVLLVYLGQRELGSQVLLPAHQTPKQTHKSTVP